MRDDYSRFSKPVGIFWRSGYDCLVTTPARNIHQVNETELADDYVD